MLPKKNKISQEVFRKLGRGRIYRYAPFDISVYTSEILHVSCIVKKKIWKKAVQRNSIKRRVYSLFTQKENKDKMKEIMKQNTYHNTYIVTPKKEIGNYTDEMLCTFLIQSVL